MRGSQRWLQILINEHPEVIFRELAPELGLDNKDQLSWLSPCQNDNYAEYCDDDFIKKLEIELKLKSLSCFWPKRGPVWDGLGKTSKNDLLLLEAKAHIGELITSPSDAKDQSSIAKIQTSLNDTKTFLRSGSKLDWSTIFYQYTNRLAHLYLLRTLNKLPAYLIFIYFLNDQDMRGPSAEAEWKGAIKLLHKLLGIDKHRLSKYVLDVFIDVNRF